MFEKLQAGEKIHDAPRQPRTCSHPSVLVLFVCGFHQQINDVEVLRVVQSGATAVYFIAAPPAEGDSVHMSVDWKR